MNRKIKKYLDEIEKTEKKIADLEMYLKGVRSALKEEEKRESEENEYGEMEETE